MAPSNGMSLSSQYVKSYTSFSGHDMVCIFELPLSNGKTITKVVGSVQTISYSIHNEKMPVRVLGNMNPINYVFGQRTIAGSIIFTVFDKHWLRDMMDEYLRRENKNMRILADEIPPINITVSMANEYGDRARLALYKVTFVNEGQVMSIQDMYTENTFQFFALDLDYLSPVTDTSTGKWTLNQDMKITEDNEDDYAVTIDSPELANKEYVDSLGNKTSVKDKLEEILNIRIYNEVPDALTSGTSAASGDDVKELIAMVDKIYTEQVQSVLDSLHNTGYIGEDELAKYQQDAQRIYRKKIARIRGEYERTTGEVEPEHYGTDAPTIDQLEAERTRTVQECLKVPEGANSGTKISKYVIHDADTIRVFLDGNESRAFDVRFYGLDASEANTEAGQNAKKRLAEILAANSGNLRLIERDRDKKYGRVVGEIVLADGTSVNAMLVHEGWSRPYSNFNGKRVDDFQKLDNDARRNRRGEYASDKLPEPPSETRKNNTN